jgi:hypothetical protein
MRTDTHGTLELDVPSIATGKKIRPHHQPAGGARARHQGSRRIGRARLEPTWIDDRIVLRAVDFGQWQATSNA